MGVMKILDVGDGCFVVLNEAQRSEGSQFIWDELITGE